MRKCSKLSGATYICVIPKFNMFLLRILIFSSTHLLKVTCWSSTWSCNVPRPFFIPVLQPVGKFIPFLQVPLPLPLHRIVRVTRRRTSLPLSTFTHISYQNKKHSRHKQKASWHEPRDHLSHVQCRTCLNRNIQ